MSEINTAATATPATVESAFDLTLRYNLDEEGRIKSLQTGGDGNQFQSVKGQITLSQFLRDFKPFGFKMGTNGKPVRPGGSSLYDLAVETTKLAYHETAEELARSSDPENTYWLDRTYSAPQTFDSLLKDWLDTKQQQRQIINQALEIRKANDERKAQEEAEKVAKRQAEINALVDEFFTDPSARVNVMGDYVGTCRGGWAVKESHPRYAEYRAEAIRRNEADYAAKEAEEAARAKAKTEQIAAWVAESGDENQRERWAAGLLPESEAVDAIKEAAFEPIVSLDLYVNIKKSDVRAKCDENCACASDYGRCEVEFESVDASKAAAEQWEKMKDVRKLLPTATVTLRQHSGTCQDDDCKTGGLTRYSLLVKLTVGAFTFTRSLAA